MSVAYDESSSTFYMGTEDWDAPYLVTFNVRTQEVIREGGLQGEYRGRGRGSKERESIEGGRGRVSRGEGRGERGEGRGERENNYIVTDYEDPSGILAI